MALLMREDPQLRSMQIQVEEFTPEDWEEHKGKTGQHPDA
jgi:hypothetical protein